MTIKSLSSSFFLLSLAAFTTASPLQSRYTTHESRSIIPFGWSKAGELAPHAPLPIRIALKQSNLDQGHEYLMDISHPSSANYGKHWTAQEVAAAFSPSQESVDVVMDWLKAAGISEDQMSRSFSKGWVLVNATVGEAESLLKAKYDMYRHEESGLLHVACEEYSVPEHVSDHVDFVTPTVHFDSRAKRASSPGKAKEIGQPGSGSLPKLMDSAANKPAFSPLSSDPLANCDQEITIYCLHALYEFTFGNSSNAMNSYGIVEYTPQSYLPTDLDMFFKLFSPSLVGDRPILDSIDGGVPQTKYEGFNYNGESNLDLEYAMSLVYPQNVTLYQTGDIVEGASFNNFLDGIDASYCTYDGGDDPTQDGVYPDPYHRAGSYEGPESCGTYAPAKVISTSYSYNEVDLTPAYEQRQCYEYMKLGLMGTTILYSSGDYGVASNANQCIDPSTGQFNNGTSGRFVPSFPASCPYVTAVGATQVAPNRTVYEPEIACATVIYSGGGFSNVFAMPDYQQSTVANYFANYAPPYTAEQYNNSQTSRGYPDVSANGAWYNVTVDGQWLSVYGTSASSPVFGSILTLINEQRYDAGKSSIGFVNPVFYEHPDVFNDITEGSNPGCGTEGFSAVPGWDPVTGLGTPNYPKMLNLFMSLP